MRCLATNAESSDIASAPNAKILSMKFPRSYVDDFVDLGCAHYAIAKIAGPNVKGDEKEAKLIIFNRRAA